MSATTVVQTVALVVQSALLLVSLVYAKRTVDDARAERTEEARRYREAAEEARAARADEARRHRDALEDERRADLERRLARVVDRVIALEDVRARLLSGDQAALMNAGIEKQRLKAAIIASGLELPVTRALVVSGGVGIAQPSEVAAALEELEQEIAELASAAVRDDTIS